jgi:AcrR family transcriptional regulator
MAAEGAPAGSRKALRWAEHKEKTRRDLLESARALFAERGFNATSVADIAAGAGVTERTLFRYFPTKSALILDETIARLPDMARLIRERPAGEGPYRAVCAGIIEFAERHRDMLIVIVGSQGQLDLPLEGRERPLIDFEDELAGVLRDRYQVPAGDLVTPGVWARASVGALRTALKAVVKGHHPGQDQAMPVFADTVRACFAALGTGL